MGEERLGKWFGCHDFATNVSHSRKSKPFSPSRIIKNIWIPAMKESCAWIGNGPHPWHTSLLWKVQSEPRHVVYKVFAPPPFAPKAVRVQKGRMGVIV